MAKPKESLLTLAEHQALRMTRLQSYWPAWVALLVIAILYEALPSIFYWGPRGLMITLVIVLIATGIVAFWNNMLTTTRYLGLLVNVIITIYLIAALTRLLQAVFEGHIGPHHLFASAIALWIANVLIFALWYWKVDAGGPLKREFIDNAHITAFLFPQAQISFFGKNDLPKSLENWRPQFIDYLFLSFNTSAAFSPTDTPVLSRWAKIMSMLQALLSLTIVLVLAARAISLINPTSVHLVS